jgi:hypothetical protein
MSATTGIFDDSVRKVAELFRLAGLIYHYRAGRSLPSDDPKVKALVESRLEIAASLENCTRAFPVVILGCQTHSDENQLVILELLRRSQESHKYSNMARAQRFIEASWAQDDLDTEGELDYVKKVDAIISLSKYLPSFAYNKIN